MSFSIPPLIIYHIITFVGSKWKSFQYQAVQYDKENGFSTWLSLHKKEVADVSNEVNTLFDNVISKMNNTQWQEILDAENGWDDFITKSKIADENFKEFLGTIDNAKFNLKDYQQWLIENGKSTSTFTDFTQKASTALKSFGASLASIGINWAIGKIIGFATTAIDNFVNRVKYANEAMKDAVSEYKSTKSNLESISSELKDQK